MNFVLSVAIYLALGIALAAATIWYGNAVWQRFFASDAAPAIAPIEIIGADEPTTKAYKAGLPVIIVAATSELKSRTNSAIKALRDAETELAQHPRLPEHQELPVPSEFHEPIAINLKIADVEVGWLLSLLFERSRDPNVVHLTVALGAKDAKSKIYGFLPGKSGYAFVTEANGDLHSISDAIAAQFVQRAARRGESAFAVLETEDFRNSILALEAYAHVSEKQQLILGASDSSSAAELRKEYANALSQVKPLAEKYTGWLGMQWLATQCARGARDWASAVEFSNNLKRLARIGNDVNLRERAAQVAQEAERELNQTQQPPAHVTIASPAVDRIFGAIGLAKDTADAKDISIGLIGPPPKDASVEVLPGATKNIDPSLQDYQTSVHQVAQMVARNAKFVYAPFGIATLSITNDALIGALKELIERKPQIILLAWGSAEPNNAIDTLIKQSADKILFVLPAGNLPGQPSSYKNVVGIALVVAAATEEGAPAPFTSVSDDVVWAPGTDIPVVVPGLNGTSYSAAVGTGAAAVLLHDFPTATPAQIREALVATGRPAPGRAKPPIINVAAARDWLRTKLGARG